MEHISIPACGSFQPYDKSINKIQDALNLEVKSINKTQDALNLEVKKR